MTSEWSIDPIPGAPCAPARFVWLKAIKIAPRSEVGPEFRQMELFTDDMLLHAQYVQGIEFSTQLMCDLTLSILNQMMFL